ncbi:hypothetical protein ES288_D10G195900v1 [Gossypium darwinii]|uniref:Uncharacterized protein n=1 Tax=Gossypium darwinii TaxID=34276 RepID=A0A5D2B4Z5_GOSDA|nr:hypothetical protein ES288_D10G195900v1 [Gossypium darwinii]
MPELSSTLSSHVRFLLQSLTEANADSVFRELYQCRSSTNKTVELVDSKTNGDLSRSKSESMNADENLLFLTRDAQSNFCSRSSTAGLVLIKLTGILSPLLCCITPGRN